MNRIDAWITFAAAAIASDPEQSIERQAEWADQMLRECDTRWAVRHWGDEYTGYAKVHRLQAPPTE